MSEYPDDCWKCTCERWHQWWKDSCEDCDCKKKDRIDDTLPEGEKDVWDD